MTDPETTDSGLVAHLSLWGINPTSVECVRRPDGQSQVVFRFIANEELAYARNPVYNSNTFSAVNAFYSFREFGTNSEQIRVMADTASVLYDATAGGQITVFNKSAGSGQTFMQSVGNTLFFANGVDQKKWIQSLFSRAASGTLPVIGNSTTLTSASTPFISTYLIDSNGNLQELLATKQTTVTNVAYVSSSNTLTLTVGSISGITNGEQFIIWDAVTAAWLNGITIQVTAAPSGSTVVAKLIAATHADYASAAETATLTLASGGTPVTGGSVPTWNTQVPSSSNNFQGESQSMEPLNGSIVEIRSRIGEFRREHRPQLSLLAQVEPRGDRIRSSPSRARLLIRSLAGKQISGR